MEIKITIPEYSAAGGIQYNWITGFEITALSGDRSVSIKANKQGLLSLANHLLNLAQDAVPVGTHIHFDEHNSLETGSLDILIEKS